MRLPARNSGFTLVEVLVAMAVFALMSALAYGALGRTIASSEILSDRMGRLQSIQRTMRQLDQDFTQLAPRPIRKDLADTYSPALEADGLTGVALELTRAGWSNPNVLPRGTLQRVAYVVEGEELRRYYWHVLDRTYSNEPVIVTLLDGIDSIAVRYLMGNGEWSDQWPPQLQGAAPDLRQRPRAVEVVLSLINEGEISRLIEVAP
ncbi:type II secretion system minor pseudopilin GspJ [Woeseia oceani]|uniref:Type II secretion system protein J n=1 Tax=Woeseia oceani TaxID=1548547 RepID=A0A193LFX6_9GAMM|nr:type II secretion system minor pseudopilin GspJ [Woeseia oceani]ANO51407.1 type II secretion system protein GspJ [Woeseia oceani]